MIKTWNQFRHKWCEFRQTIRLIDKKQNKNDGNLPYLPYKEVAMNLTDKELNLILEWFGTVQDIAHKNYLKKVDYDLARSIFIHLGRRTPKSIKEKS